MDAAVWDERYRAVDLVWGAAPNIFVRQFCEGLAPGTALDLACGEGRNALWLAQEGWTATASDFSPVAIERARTLTTDQPDDVRRRLTWEVADVTVQDLGQCRYDLVLLSYLHLGRGELKPVLARAVAALRAAGTLLSIGHDRRNIAEGVGGPQDPELLHVPRELREDLEGMPGVTVQRAETTPREAAEGTALDTVVVARRTAA